jgi:hypothetical protein
MTSTRHLMWLKGKRGAECLQRGDAVACGVRLHPDGSAHLDLADRGPGPTDQLDEGLKAALRSTWCEPRLVVHGSTAAPILMA